MWITGATMFETLPNPSIDTLLIVGRAALLVGAFWVFALAFIRWRRADERNAQVLHAQLQRAFAEIRSMHETMTVMNARLESMGERPEADSRLAPAGTAASQRGYDLATRLARNGTGVEELVTTCGVTRHEAELLTRLHGSKAKEPVAGWQNRATVEKAPSPAWQVAQTARAQAPAQAVPQPAPTGRKRGSLLSVVG
jgi:Protein of unknown function (DUF2802)